jgi:DNA-binding transcriptional LysR family regulator
VGIAVLDPISARALSDMNVVLRPFSPLLGEDFALLTPRDQPVSQLAQEFIGVFRQRFSQATRLPWERQKDD